jgi:hypothetical protein
MNFVFLLEIFKNRIQQWVRFFFEPELCTCHFQLI